MCPNFSISSIIVELGAHRKFSRRKYRRVNIPKNCFPRPCYEREKPSASEREQALSGRLTFPMNPKEGSRFGCFPCQERVSLNKQRARLSVPRFQGGIVIFSLIGGGEPILNIAQHLFTYQRISTLPSSNANVR